jgi:putative ABC transport system ATP-binding protein
MSQVVVDHIFKDYHLGKTVVHALRGVTTQIDEGEFVAIAGPSGSGKTTLLNIIGCLESPTSGKLFVDGEETAELTDNVLSDLRAKKIGFVFQNFNLLPVLTALENVEYPLHNRKMNDAGKRQLAEKVLNIVGLGKFLHHKPLELSGGQRQRVAIARAIITNPKIILADEPTANLDQKTGAEILTLIKQINHSFKTTVIFSTHDPKVIQLARRVIRVQDGLIVEAE